MRPPVSAAGVVLAGRGGASAAVRDFLEPAGGATLAGRIVDTLVHGAGPRRQPNHAPAETHAIVRSVSIIG